MTNGLIALLVAASASTWIYSKISRSSGNNVSGSLTVAGVSGAVIFVVVLLLLKLIPN